MEGGEREVAGGEAIGGSREMSWRERSDQEEGREVVRRDDFSYKTIEAAVPITTRFYD